MINSKRIKSVLLFLLFLSLFAAFRAEAELTLKISSAEYVHDFKNPTSLGVLLYRQNRDGERGGDLQGSYICSPTLTKVSYSGGKIAEGTCLVLKDEKGGAYMWDLCGWDGKEPIQCELNNSNYPCRDVEVYGNCDTTSRHDSIPEPGTVAAALGILLPFILNTIWLLRRQKAHA